MSYELEINPEDSYLQVKAVGTRNRSNIKAISKEVIEACSKYQVNKIIVDIQNLQGRLSIFDSYTLLSSDFKKVNVENIVNRVVVIDTEDRKERARFFNRVAKSMNLDIRIFDDFEKALNWLEIE